MDVLEVRVEKRGRGGKEAETKEICVEVMKGAQGAPKLQTHHSSTKGHKDARTTDLRNGLQIKACHSCLESEPHACQI